MAAGLAIAQGHEPAVTSPARSLQAKVISNLHVDRFVRWPVGLSLLGLLGLGLALWGVLGAIAWRLFHH